MDWQEAVEIVATRRNSPRLRELCSDDWPDATEREGYRRYAIRLATNVPATDASPDRPTVAEAWDLTRRMLACPYRSTQGCGCSGARCALHGRVSHRDCFECLKRYG